MNFNLAVILRETASAAPDRPAALYSGGELSYGDLDMLSDRLAAGLELAGVRPGERVGLQLPNRLLRDPQVRRGRRPAERDAEGPRTRLPAR
jgi:non-ribosomal peptide synthetase component E (peptide arylation enzyme)